MATRRNEGVGGKSGPKQGDLAEPGNTKGPKLSATGRAGLGHRGFWRDGDPIYPPGIVEVAVELIST
jgi:hypothetical protein